MKIYRFSAVQKLPLVIEDAWDFFSEPNNLSKITPKSMKFKVLSDLPDEMYEGMIITYKVSPLFNLSLNWVTEITHVNKPNFFVDEQRFGPYKFWHHKHLFRKIDGGIEMKDIVDYGLPFGIFGRAANPLIVAKKINEIFVYRKEILEKFFGKYETVNELSF